MSSLRQSCNMTNSTATAPTYTTSFGSAVLGGSLLHCTVRCGAQATMNVSDTVNGAWTRLGNFVSNGSNSCCEFFVISKAGSPIISIGDTNATNVAVQAYIGEYPGIAGLRNFGQIAAAGAGTTTGTTPNAAAVVNIGDLVIVGIINQTSVSGTYAAGALSGVTGTLAMGSTGVTNQNACQEWANATSSGTAVTATATDGSITWVMGISVFIPAATNGPLMLLGCGT
jgi:hypothetical protein